MRQLGNLLNDWQRFITCSNKVMEIEVSRPEIVDSSCAVNHDHIEGAISFDHVSFAYGSQPVLSERSPPSRGRPSPSWGRPVPAKRR
jgi:ABC-type multidrug transport system fused ATPase/permease subunit